MTELRNDSVKHIISIVGENGAAIFNPETYDPMYISYDGGNHPYYRSTMCNEVFGIKVKKGRVYLITEEEDEYSQDRVDCYDLFNACLHLQNSIKIGDRVRWNDPDLEEYEDSEDALERVFIVTDFSGDIINIKEENGNSEAEVYYSELEVIKNITWDYLKSVMLKSKRLKKAYKIKETDMTFESVVNELVCLWEGMYHTTPEDYIDNENIWVEELNDLL